MEKKSGEHTDQYAQNIRYLVTGAGGHLGSTILRFLSQESCEVYGLLFPGEKPKITAANIRYFEGDIRDQESLRPFFENPDRKRVIVIHAAAMISISQKLTAAIYAVNVTGVRNVLQLCQEYRVERLVHVSSVHALPELPHGEVIREVDHFSPELVRGGYAKTKAEAAQAVLDAVSDGLNAVLVFPSGILGPYDNGQNHIVQMIADYLHGKLPACVQGRYNFVDVRDVAAGCIAAAGYGRRGACYLLTGEEYTIPEILDMVAQQTGQKKVAALPIRVAKLAVPFFAIAAKIRHQRPLFTGYSLYTLQSNCTFSNEKAKRELGFTTRNKKETITDMTKWLERG